MQHFKQLLENRVLIKPDAAAEVSDGGIIIPETAKQITGKGTVIDSGNGYVVKEGNLAGTKIPMTVKVGDKVLYDPHLGMELELDKEKVLMILETGVWAVI